MAGNITIPDTATGLEEFLNDPAKMSGLDRDGLKDFTKAYAKKVLQRDPSMTDQMREEIQKVTRDFLVDNASTGARPTGGQRLTPNVQPLSEQDLRNRRRAGVAYNPSAPGARLDGEFDDIVDFAATIWHRQTNNDLLEKRGRVYDAFSEGSPSDGGFLVPEALRAEMMSVALEQSIVRSRAHVVPMETLRVSYPMIDSQSNTSSVFGGVAAYWTDEGQALIESSAKFGKITLDAKKLTALANVPNELLRDSMISFEAFIKDKYPQAINFFEDTAFFSGDGVGEPMGFMNGPSVVSVAKESGQAASTIVWENVIRMFSRMLPTSLGSAVWIASIDTFPELATMALSVGTGGGPVWFGGPTTPGTQAPPVTILGRPVIFTEKSPALGAAGDLMFTDLSYYLIGDRQRIEADSSPHYKFANDVTSYRFIERVDGRPWLQNAITPANGGPALSPFVQMVAR